MEITPHIARLVLKDYYPDNRFKYKSHVINGDELRITIVDIGGSRIGQHTYTTQYVAIPDILNHPIVIQYNRELKIDNII